MKISKGFIGASALAAALAIAPAAFAEPCGGMSQGASNTGYSNQGGMNGWQSSSGEAASWKGHSAASRSGVREQNARLTREANDAIERDPNLQDQNVHAWVNANRVVVLRGEADSAAEAMRAQRVIAQFTGLKSFDNELYYPGMYGEQATKTMSQSAQNDNAQTQSAQTESSEEENSENSATEDKENVRNENGENAAAENHENAQGQNNGAASSSGPATGSQGSSGNSSENE